MNHDYFYKVHCRDLEVRLRQYIAGMTESIKPYIPFKLVYIEQFETETEAIQCEKYFKSSAGRRFLKNKLAS